MDHILEPHITMTTRFDAGRRKAQKGGFVRNTLLPCLAAQQRAEKKKGELLHPPACDFGKCLAVIPSQATPRFGLPPGPSIQPTARYLRMFNVLATLVLTNRVMHIRQAGNNL